MEKACLFQDHLRTPKEDENEFICTDIDPKVFLEIGNYIYQTDYRKSFYNLKIEELGSLEKKLIEYNGELSELVNIKKQICESIINISSSKKSNTNTFLYELYSRKTGVSNSYRSILKKQDEIIIKIKNLDIKRNDILIRIKEISQWINKYNQDNIN